MSSPWGEALRSGSPAFLLQSPLYEAPLHLAGETIEARFDPLDPAAVEIYFQGRLQGVARSRYSPGVDSSVSLAFADSDVAEHGGRELIVELQTDRAGIGAGGIARVLGDYLAVKADAD